MAELVLAEDKGWDAAKTRQRRCMVLARQRSSSMDKKIPMHLVYFTAWVDDDGQLRTFSDIYGHEKRITLALDGKWDKIDIGRDHLAPVEPGQIRAPSRAPSAAARQRRSKQPPTIVDMVGNALGGAF